MGDTATPTTIQQPPLSLPSRPNRAPSSYTTSYLAASATPSLLTPNTRSEAEAALSHNAGRQTDSAAPTSTEVSAFSPPSLQPASSIESVDSNAFEGINGAGMRTEEGRRMSLGIRPTFLPRSSTNYITALAAAEERLQESLRSSPAAVRSDHVESSNVGDNSNEDGAVAVNGGGPVGGGRLARVTLERQMSWNEQDMKRMMQQKILEAGGKATGVGYSSVGEEKDA